MPHDAVKAKKTMHFSKKSLKLNSDTNYLSAEKFRKALTPKRLALWRIIRDQHPPTVQKLSQICARDPKSVHRDLEILNSLGIVGLEQGFVKPGRSVRPVCLMDSIYLEVK